MSEINPQLNGVDPLITALDKSIAEVIKGKSEVISLALCALLSEGHLLIEDVPGVGKTSLAKAIASASGCEWRRIQFTSDLLPSDVTGNTIYNQGSGSFEFRPGAVFANIVLGDEINRASPKTQSALLEAMQERQVSYDGKTYALPNPFMVIATQNPIEYEGTFPLPEAELDRFLLRVTLGYPSRDAELEMMNTHSIVENSEAKQVCTPDELSALIERARNIFLAPSVLDYIVDISEATRQHPQLALGVSPRSSLAMQAASRSWAFLCGRDFVTPDDIQAVAHAVMDHRLLLTPEARLSGVKVANVVDDILTHTPVPTSRS